MHEKRTRNKNNNKHNQEVSNDDLNTMGQSKIRCLGNYKHTATLTSRHRMSKRCEKLVPEKRRQTSILEFQK